MTWLARIVWPFIFNYIKTMLARRAAKIVVAKAAAYAKKKAKK